MLTKAVKYLRTHFLASMIIGGIIGALLSWGVNWILPSKTVDVNNMPKKELTCTLDFSLMMVSKRVSDDKLQILYDGNAVESPYIYSITVKNTGEYSISNEDFKDAFSINFIGSNKMVHARVSKSTNQSVTDEVLSSAKVEGTTLTIEDFFLNVDEFFTIYIISDGKPDTILYNARIADISTLTLRNTPKENRDERIRNMYFVTGGVLFLFATSIIGFIIYENRMRKKMNDELKQIVEKYTPQDL